MGRQNKWKVIMDLEVQDPNDKSIFSSKDLDWSEIHRRDTLLVDRVALIPSHRVLHFIRGKETNLDSPCTFLRVTRKNTSKRDSSSLRYEL